MENLPQPWRHKCASCEEKQSQKGTLLQKLSLQFPVSRSADRTDSDPLEGTTKSFLQEVNK